MNTHLDKLKATADTLGISYSPNIGAGKLQDKIDAMEQIDAEKKALTAEAPKPKVASKAPKKLTDVQLRILHAKALKKVKVVNMDPENRAATTAFSGVENMHMAIQRVIPLGKVMGLEECICQELEARSYTSSEPETDKNGVATGNFVTIAAPVYQVIRY